MISKNPITVTFLIAGLAACGGGGGGGTTSSAPTGNNQQTATSRAASTGPIQEFGSVVVNGVRFDTSRASFSIDGQTGSQSQLFVGQKVTVNGSLSDDGVSGVADSVIFEAELEGPVGSITRADNRFTVLGQTVLVDGTTTYQNTSFATLAVNDRVEVSGEFDANGLLRAYAIELETNSGSRSNEVKGSIASFNNNSQRFNLNTLVVDFSNAVLEPSNAGLANGQFVEAEGSIDANGVLIAQRVELESRNQFDDDDRDEDAEVTGFIESVLSSTRFIAAGLTIEHGPSTRFENGSAADLQANVRMEAEGFLNANGVLIADEIEIKRAAQGNLAIKLEAPVQSVDSNAGQLRLLNITINTDNNTLIRDERSNQQPFGLANLQVGDFVEVRAFPSNGQLIAGKIERDDDEGRVILQATLDSKDAAARMLVIATLSISTNGARYEAGDDDQNLTEQQFYAQAQAGDLIKVKGTFNGSTINAFEVSFENDDDESDDDDNDEDDRDDDDRR